MDELSLLIENLSKISPLGVIALLVIVVWYLVKNKGLPPTSHELENNHLHTLPEIAETLKRIESTMNEMSRNQREEFGYIRGRLNGKDK